jgi:hypothetical protein
MRLFFDNLCCPIHNFYWTLPTHSFQNYSVNVGSSYKCFAYCLVCYFFTFTWKQLNNELKCSYPMLATVMESVVWDIPQSVSSKAFCHIMLATALGLHGRSHEMSAIQHIVLYASFIMTTVFNPLG